MKIPFSIQFLKPDRIKTIIVNSKSTLGHKYEVRIFLSCECNGRKYRPTKLCRHLSEAVERYQE